MHIRKSIAFALLAAVGTAQAQTLPTLPTVEAVQHVFDCRAPRRLPSQAEVGEWTGEHNFARVYEVRATLMAEVAHACKKPGVAQVQLLKVRDPAAAASPRWVAIAEPAAR